ncbi:hypothetical protein LINPERPRIM_LOCUS41243 [Linum perenne]
MSSFFRCHPSTSCLQTWPNIWFDDISALLDSIRSECESNYIFVRWNGRLRKETIIHQLMTSRQFDIMQHKWN